MARPVLFSVLALIVCVIIPSSQADPERDPERDPGFILRQLQPVPQRIGQSIQLQCGVDLHHIRASEVDLLRWTIWTPHGKSKVINAATGRMSVSIVDDGYEYKNTLTIKRFQQSDARDFQCEIQIGDDVYTNILTLELSDADQPDKNSKLKSNNSKPFRKLPRVPNSKRQPN